MGMWQGAGVMGGQPVENPPTSFLIAKGTRPWSRMSGPSMTTSLPSRANAPPAPVLGGPLGYSKTPQTSFGGEGLYI